MGDGGGDDDEHNHCTDNHISAWFIVGRFRAESFTYGLTPVGKLGAGKPVGKPGKGPVGAGKPVGNPGKDPVGVGKDPVGAGKLNVGKELG